MKKIVVLISGGGSNLEAIAKACQIGNIPASIELVISNQSNVKGLERAKKFHLMSKVIEHQNFNTREEFDQALLEQILPLEPDLVVLAGFMRILSNDFTDALNGKLINIHPSYLPKFKGLNAQEQAIKAKSTFSGCTVHYVSSKIDSGEIILQKKVKILKKDNTESLSKKILIEEHKIYPRALQMVARRLLKQK